MTPTTPADAWVVVDPTTCPVCGRDACEEHLPTSLKDIPLRRRFRSAAEIMQIPTPRELVEGVAWERCVTVLVSESGTGKTFVLIDLTAAISEGLRWHGRIVEQGSVAYLSFEGDALNKRMRAVEEVAGRRLTNVYPEYFEEPLSPRVDRDGEQRSRGELEAAVALDELVERLNREGKPPITLIVVDTVRASLAGSEDSSEHVSAYIRAVRRLLTHAPGAGAILAHHAGWQDGDTKRKRERGSSAWRGNVDGTLYLEAGPYDRERREAELTLKTEKVRDGEKPPDLHFIRRQVELLEMNRRGEPVTSCVIEPDRRTRQDREAEITAAAEQQDRAVDLRVLKAIAEHPEATSQDRLRLVLLPIRKDVVGNALARLVRLQWVRMPEKQRQPYTLTPAGRAALGTTV